MSEPEQAGVPGKEPKVIKRYTNRKLYDTVESRYVTLDEIAEMIKEGVEVRIVDNRTKEDLTSVTLAQIIFEEEKKQNQMPLAVLREIIRHPGESPDRLHPEGGHPARGLHPRGGRVAAWTSCCGARTGRAGTPERPHRPPSSRPRGVRQRGQRPLAARRSCSRRASARSRTGSGASTSG